MSAFSAEQLEQLAQLIRKVVREELDASGLEAKPKPQQLLGYADMHAAAKHFKTSYSQVREWIVDGGLPATEVEPNPRTKHRLWRIDLAQMDAWIRGGGPEALAREQKARQPTPERIAEIRAKMDEEARQKGFKNWADQRADRERRRLERAAHRRNLKGR